MAGLLALLALGEQLAGAIKQLPLQLAYLDRVDGVIGSDLLNCLAATDRFHGDIGTEVGGVDQLLLIGGSRDPALNPIIRPIRKKQFTSQLGVAGTYGSYLSYLSFRATRRSAVGLCSHQQRISKLHCRGTK